MRKGSNCIFDLFWPAPILKAVNKNLSSTTSDQVFLFLPVRFSAKPALEIVYIKSIVLIWSTSTFFLTKCLQFNDSSSSFAVFHKLKPAFLPSPQMILDNYSSSFFFNKFPSCLETSVCFLDQTCSLKLLKKILKNALVIKFLFIPVMINIHLYFRSRFFFSS